MGLLRRPEGVNWGTKDSRRGELGPNGGGGGGDAARGM